MKNIIIIILCSINFLHAQNDKFMGGAIFAFSEHDTRLFEWPNQELYLSHEDDLGTYLYGIQLKKSLLNKKLLQCYLGLGLNKEVITFYRPYNQYYFTQGPTHSDIKVIKRYTASTFAIPIDLNFSPIKLFYLQLNIMPSFDFKKRVLAEGGYIQRRWHLDFFATEINPGIGIRLAQWHFNCNFRLFQYKKIDKVTIWSELFTATNPPNPHLLEKYETYNPFKLWLSVNYTFKML